MIVDRFCILKGGFGNVIMDEKICILKGGFGNVIMDEGQ
jgi:hypothetical protein